MGICGLIDYSGNIIFSGEIINGKSVIEYRDIVSFAHQNNYFFDETLQFKLSLGDENSTDEEILSLLNHLQLSDRINLLENGLDVYCSRHKKTIFQVESCGD